MVQFKVYFTYFSLVLLASLVSEEGFGQGHCFCEFERGQDKDGYTTVNVFSMNPENYGLIGSIAYKVLRNEIQSNKEAHQSSYPIEVRLDGVRHQYRMKELQLYDGENKIGYASNLNIGLTKIIPHLLPKQCTSATQMQGAQKEILFNAQLK